MEPTFQTSFIPKKPLATERVVPERSVSILSFLSIIIIVGVCILGGGLFVYKNLLVSQKSDLSKSLALSRDGFEQNTISELSLFNKRTSASKQILTNHFALSPLFKTLSAITVPSIQFTKFENTSDNNNFSVHMSGLARDYASIAVQAQVLNSDKGRYFKNVVFSNIVLSDSPLTKGYVSFNISFDVDPSLLSYEKNVVLEAPASSVVVPSVMPSITPSIPIPISNQNQNQTTNNVTPPSPLPAGTPAN